MPTTDMKTRVVTIGPGDLDGEAIRAAGRLLDSGQIVAFPTETVYGLGCVAEPGPIARLDEVKGRPTEKRYTLHIGDKEQVYQYVPRIGPRARKLIEHVWPGPITVVFSLDRHDLQRQKAKLSPGAFSVLYGGGTIGIRCIDNRIGQALLRRAAGPVVAPSANRSGEKPAVTAEEVLAAYGGKIAMIVSGPDEQNISGQSSTVVKVTDTSVSVLRKGAVSLKALEEMSTIKVLFVCTGNTCRSPMAAGLFRKLLSEKLNCGVDELERVGYIVLSCGLASGGGGVASPHAIEVCRVLGADISGHRSRPFDCKEAQECDYIFGMTRQHVDAVVRSCPETADKCVLLDEAGDISDPIGGNVEMYRWCAQQIDKALRKRLGEIWDENCGSK
jgi:tRNA threonylcarbamoyl adenosine modification protein (Sua5/YciO/YrdC/YwlC family)